LKEYINDEDNVPSSSIIYPYLYAGFNVNWENLSNNYYEKYFSKPVNDKIKTFTDKLIKNEKDPEKIIKIIYEHINRSIDLVGIPLDECGYSPIEESKILNYSGLSVLDKSYLFTRMAKSQGISVRFLLYRSNDRANLINEIPSLKQFDSVICETEIGKNKTLVSFENENFNIGQTYFNTSKAQILDLSSKNSKPVILSETDIEKNKTEINYNCTLNDNNSISITRTTIINGSNQADWRGKRFQSKEELDKWAKSRMTNLGGDAVIESYKFINDLADFDKPVIFEEKIKINNFSFSSGENLKLFKIPDLNYRAGNVNKNERNFPFDFGRTGITINKYNLTIPDSYKFLYIPKSLDLIYDGFSFKENYSTENNKLILSIETIITKTIIPVQKYNDVKNWYEKRSEFSNQWIMIEK
jgi:hypothetical protein